MRLIISILFMALSFGAAAQANSFDPESAYAPHEIEGWRVLVNQKLLAETNLCERIMKVLSAQLYQITRVVPAAALAKIRQIPIWVELDDPLFPGMCYHESRDWLESHGVNPAKTDAVEPPDRVPMTEDLPQRPINPYGEAKLMFEKVLIWYQQLYKLEFIAFRYFNAAGASEKFGEHHRTETHIIPNVLFVALGQKPQCEIYGTDYPTPDGTCIRDYIHIKDLAQAHMLGLQPGKTGFYNLGNGDGYSVRQVIQACEKIAGKKIPTVEKPRRPGDPLRLVASAEKAVRELGWKPKLPKLDDFVATACAWHKKHPNGYAD